VLNFLLPIIRAAIQISDLTLKCYSEVDRTQQRYSRPTMQRVKCQNQQRKAILKLHEGLQSLHIMLTIGSFIFFLLNILYKLQFVTFIIIIEPYRPVLHGSGPQGLHEKFTYMNMSVRLHALLIPREICTTRQHQQQQACRRRGYRRCVGVAQRLIGLGRIVSRPHHSSSSSSSSSSAAVARCWNQTINVVHCD